MYYQNYEEYMRDVLGYPNEVDSRNMMPTYAGYQDMYTGMPQMSMSNREIENLYPDIYRVVYPMVCKVCDRNTRTNYARKIKRNGSRSLYALGN